MLDIERSGVVGSSDEGEAETSPSDSDHMDQEDEDIDIKDEPEADGKEVYPGDKLPAELELRTCGVWARAVLPRGLRFGPFKGTWTCYQPSDPDCYWEVREQST